MENGYEVICPFLKTQCLGFSETQTCPFWDQWCVLASAANMLATTVNVTSHVDGDIFASVEGFIGNADI